MTNTVWPAPITTPSILWLPDNVMFAVVATSTVTVADIRLASCKGLQAMSPAELDVGLHGIVSAAWFATPLSGRPVAFVNVSATGVSRLGAVKEAFVANITAPEPDTPLLSCDAATCAQFATPAAVTPVEYWPLVHWAGAAAKAVAVAALPVVL